MSDLVQALSDLTLGTIAKVLLAFFFVDILRKLIVPKIIERVLTRGFNANEIARLALVDILGFLRRVELIARALQRDQETLRSPGVTTWTDLGPIGSEYRLEPLALGKDKLLDSFADEELQRRVILLHESYQRFRARSADNRESFYWLLDNHVVWRSNDAGSCGRVRERLEMLNTARKRMASYTFQMLSDGYRTAELLCLEVSTSPWTLRGSFAEFERVLQRLYALDGSGIAWRRAFYAVPDRHDIFLEERPLALVRWNDSIARDEPDAVAEVEIELAFDGSRARFQLPAGVDAALPAGTIQSGKVLVRRKRRKDEARTIARPVTLVESRRDDLAAKEIALFSDAVA
jgi:hypothetical protein